MKTLKRFWWFYAIYGTLTTVLAIERPESLFLTIPTILIVIGGDLLKLELDRVKKQRAIEQDISENRARTINDLRATIERMQAKKPICVIGNDRDLKDFLREQSFADRGGLQVLSERFYMVYSDDRPQKVMGMQFSEVIWVGGFNKSQRTIELYDEAKRRVR